MSNASPVITAMQVIPVAGYDSMLLNLCGAHAPFFTRNLVLLTDSAGNTGMGEVPGGGGILAALESFLTRDHAAEWAEWERRANLIIASVTSVPGVKAEMYLPEIFNRWPHIRVTWDETKLAAKPADIIHKMRHGEPSILVFPSQGGLDLGVITLKPGEDRIVARRLKQELQAGRA